MKVYDLDNRLTTWKMSGLSSKDHRTKSSLHTKARGLLEETYPTFKILEEVTIPLQQGHVCFLDFYIPLLKTAIEVHGSQHYEYNSLFHTDIRSFIKQKKRDSDKALWCENNNINLIVLSYKEAKTWINQLQQKNS
jgi:hypothetical protein